MKTLRIKWLTHAIGGLLLLGFGLSLFGEALALKIGLAPTMTWFIFGTGALVVFNAGVSIFGKSLIIRTQMLAEEK